MKQALTLVIFIWIKWNQTNIKYSTGYDWQTTFGTENFKLLCIGCWLERSKKLDVGLEMTLFRHWNITADYFYENVRTF